MSISYSRSIDKKWQDTWYNNGLYTFNPNSNKEALYLLEMFSYPSASKLHLGHWWNYSLPDAWARMKTMQGYNVFHPVGFDAFGLPAENFAKKAGIHPRVSTYQNINTMIGQLKGIGTTYDWNHLVITSDPEYYKWTQWLFLKLYENKLAYQKEANVNWCPDCKTVLANEQVKDGHCERCGTAVIQKDLKQWFFAISNYADELADGLEALDWSDVAKDLQRNWIGRSYGAVVSFDIENSSSTLRTYTTRLDTLMGVTFIAIAPENPLVKELTTKSNLDNVNRYLDKAKHKTELERKSESKNISGVFSGSYAVHPLTHNRIPIWISDYVIMGSGTGAVMGVPAHDDRDYRFATSHDIPVLQVLEGEQNSKLITEYTPLQNSGKYNGLMGEEAKKAILEDLKAIGKGEKSTNFRLRDWLVSRQRYWGAPIPIIYCDTCGTVPVPEDQLPVELPENVSFSSEGSPLASCHDFVETICPVCGRPARRETDTLDTFVCSSWYYLRFFDNHYEKAAWDINHVNSMLPVDVYVGGIEHVTMHLLYARFIFKVMRDLGYVSLNEPFLRLINQGIILGSDGQKMSKSKGNAISPDDYVDKYGADVFRCYLAFGFSYTEGGPWDDKGITSMVSFFNKISRILDSFLEFKTSQSTEWTPDENTDTSDIDKIRHSTIKRVTEDVERFSFNTAIARLMEFRTAIANYQKSPNRDLAFETSLINDFLVLFSPFSPHFSEELWEKIGHETSIFKENWPSFDEAKLVGENIEIAVQINGKLRDVIVVPNNITKDSLVEMCKNSEKTIILKTANIKKIIYVPNKIINFVV